MSAKYFISIFSGLCFLLLRASFVPAQEAEVDQQFRFAKQLLDDKLYTLAAEQFAAFAEERPNSDNADDALYECGTAYLAAEDYESAFEAFRSLEVTYPLSPLLPKSRFEIALVKARLKNFATAAELFKRVPRMHPGSDLAPRAYLESGRLQIKIGAEQAALAVFFKLIDEYPDAAERLDAHAAIVQIHIDRKDFDEAIRHLDGVFRVYGADFSDVRLQLMRALVFEQIGQFKKAESTYQKLAENSQDAQASVAKFRLGRMYQKRGQHEIAIGYYDAYLSSAPDGELRAAAFLNKGDILADNNPQEALKNYQESSRLSAGWSKFAVDFKSAGLLALLGSREPAIQLLTQIVTAEDESVVETEESRNVIEEAYFALAKNLVELGRPSRALDLFNEFKSRFTSSSRLDRVHLARAEILEKNVRDHTRALRLYDDFQDAFPASRQIDDAQLGVARCYEGLEEYGLATREYGNYLARYPAGNQYEWARNRKQLITETVPLKPYDDLTRISHLLATYTAGNAKIDLPFELGKLYFQNRKFRPAIAQFKQVLKSPGDEEAKDGAYYFLGNCYFWMGEYFKLLDKPGLAAAHRDSANVVLNFLKSRRESKWAQPAYFLIARSQFAVAQSDSNTLVQLLELRGEAERLFPNSEQLDFILLKLANELLKSWNGDTTLALQPQDIYREIQENYPNSEYREEAAFRECVALASLKADSLAFSRLRDFEVAFSVSRFLPPARLLKARLQRRAMEFTDAIDTLNRFIDDYFYSDLAAEAQLLLAETYHDVGDFQSAIDNFNGPYFGEIKANGTNGIVDLKASIFKEARALQELGHHTAALQRFATFIGDYPEHEDVPIAKMALARSLKKETEIEFAKTYYQGVLDHESDRRLKYEARSSLGDIFYEQQLYEEARTHYLMAIRLAGDLGQEEFATRQLIRCKYHLKQFAAADSDLKIFRRRFKDARDSEGAILYDKGQAYLSDKNFELAEKTFKTLRDDFENTDHGARAELGLGQVYLITNHTEDALKILTRIPEKYPDSEVTVATYFNLGDFYYKSGQVENAMAAFKHVVIHPKSGNYYQGALGYLIRCYRDLSLWDQAIASTREYLDRFPGAADQFARRIDLAKFLMKLHEYDRAIEQFRRLKAYADSETEAEVQFYIGQSYKEMGNFKRAASEYLKVKYLTKPSRLPWHVTAMFEASQCLEKIGQQEQAITILERIVREHGVDSNFGRFAQQKLAELTKLKNPTSQKDDS